MDTIFSFYSAIKVILTKNAIPVLFWFNRFISYRAFTSPKKTGESVQKKTIFIFFFTFLITNRSHTIKDRQKNLLIQIPLKKNPDPKCGVDRKHINIFLNNINSPFKAVLDAERDREVLQINLTKQEAIFRL